ncbi:MAG: radical SAM protein [Candidatus Tantalella remota]|nr:radical SAM protein [Candidatus Tantalella remota]
MEHLTDHIVSYLNLLRFYKGLFSMPRLIQAGLETVFTGASSFPVTIDMIITNRCNLSCPMCYRRGPRGETSNDGEGELSLEEIKKFISEVKGHRPVICLGGGEPFMRKDLIDIIKEIKSAGLKCILYTNAVLMNEDRSQQLLDTGVDAVLVSLYAWGIKHDSVVGEEGAFEKTRENLRALVRKRTKGTKILASTLLLPDNIDQIPEMIRALREVGVDGVKIEGLSFLTREEYEKSAEHPEGMDISTSTRMREEYFSEEFADTVKALSADIQREFRGFAIFKPHLGREELGRWYTEAISRNAGCSFIRHSAFIDHRGNVLPCQYFPKCVLGNLRESSFTSIWNSKEYRKARRSIAAAVPPVCSRCCKN